MQPIVVVIDTTEFKEAPRLERAGWPQLLAWVRAGIVDCAVSEVVLREATRHYARRRQDELHKLKQAAKKFTNSEATKAIDLDAVAREVADDTHAYYNWLRSELEASGVVIWPLPEVSHEDVLARDLAERKPFSSTGKGYRDALIWESLLEHLPLDQAEAHVLLVTRNSGDFAADDGALDPGLTAEAAVKGTAVSLASSLKAAVDLLREDAEEELEALFAGAQELADADDINSTVRDAVVDAAQRLAGTEIAEDTHATPTTGLELSISREVEGAEITDVSADPLSVVLDVYDTYEGDTLAIAATVSAELSIEGFVYKSDYYAGLEEKVSVVDPDWNDHMMLVTIYRQVELQFNVLTVGGQIEDITFDTAEVV